jgi:SAM-dependent methyltransferase
VLNVDPQKYIENFGDLAKLNRKILLNEMDRVWDAERLDNTIPLSVQVDNVNRFYGHPVWLLNGLFSETDLESREHRMAIAAYVKTLTSEIKRLADFGGGSGYLAGLIHKEMPDIEIEIIEPYPSDFFTKRSDNSQKLKFVPNLSCKYDLIIAQDVLEHIDRPIDVALEIIDATRMNGRVIFANCFYPHIKCHLPATFYLRYQFKGMMKHAGLAFEGAVPGAAHAVVFRRTGSPNLESLRRADVRAKRIGPVINKFMHLASMATKRSLDSRKLDI